MLVAGIHYVGAHDRTNPGVLYPRAGGLTATHSDRIPLPIVAFRVEGEELTPVVLHGDGSIGAVW